MTNHVRENYDDQDEKISSESESEFDSKLKSESDVDSESAEYSSFSPWDGPNSIINEDYIMKINMSYFEKHNTNETKIQSMNKFAKEGLPNIYKNAFPIIVIKPPIYQWIILDTITVNKPVMTETDGTSHPIYPREARFRNETYGANYSGHLTYVVKQMPTDEPVTAEVAWEMGKQIHFHRTPQIHLTKFPVMLNSILCWLHKSAEKHGECSSDNGGYVIVDGAEKSLMFRERLSFDTIFLLPKNKKPGHIVAQYRSEYFNEFKSSRNVEVEIPKATKRRVENLLVNCAPVNGVSWMIFMRALGFERDDELHNMVKYVARERYNDVYSRIFKATFETDQKICSQRHALEFIGRMTFLGSKATFNSIIEYKYEDINSVKQSHKDVSDNDSDNDDDEDERSSSTTNKRKKSSKKVKKVKEEKDTKYKSTQSTKSKKIKKVKKTTKGKEKKVKKTKTKKKILIDAGTRARTKWEYYGRDFIRTKFFPNMNPSDQTNLEECSESDKKKAWVLIDMACQVIDYFQNPSLQTNKDVDQNKQTESCEDLCGQIIRQLLDEQVANIKKIILKKMNLNKPIDVTELFAEDYVYKGFKECLATGVWHAKKGGKITQTGVSQKMDRANYVATQAQHMKVINNSLRKTMKATKPRLLNSSSIGTTCPTDSPEGEQCGLIKFKTMMQHSSLGDSGEAITHLLLNVMSPPVVELNKLQPHNFEEAIRNQYQHTIVCVNGIPIGVHNDTLKVVEFVRACRRNLSVSHDTGVSYNTMRVDVRTDRGRSLRPLLVAENLHLFNDYLRDSHKNGRLRWETLVAKGFIEYVDKMEEVNCMFAKDAQTYLDKNCKWVEVELSEEEQKEADEKEKLVGGGGRGNEEMINNSNEKKKRTKMVRVYVDNIFDLKVFYDMKTLFPKYWTHLEISPYNLLSVCAGIIPFLDHNQSPRNTYQCAMEKSAQGASTSTSRADGVESSALELWYAQRPLIQTQVSQILNCQKFPSGQNIIMAIASIGKEGQDDANISNKMALDLGMMRSTIRRTTTISEKKQNKPEHCEEFGWVENNQLSGRKRANYSWVELDGTPAIGSPIEASSILAQKYKTLKIPIVINNSQRLLYQDVSVSNLLNNSGRVNRVSITSTADGVRTIKVNIRCVALVNIGDKFAARHGQKGINSSHNASDMMYTEDGLIPNWIINSSAFSSRMTWGVWLEMIFAIVCVLNGRIGDATPFSKQYRKGLYRKLADYKKNFHMKDPVDEICDALRFLGWSGHGEHVMYNGSNGHRFASQIFCCPAYEQRLKHMVKDKVRARGGTGRVHVLTRQPVEGRIITGGLRFSEMERDCLISHQAAANTQDRMSRSSDPACLNICRKCRSMVTVPIGDKLKDIHCRVCGYYGTVLSCSSNTTFNVVYHQFLSAGLQLKMGVEPI